MVKCPARITQQEAVLTEPIEVIAEGKFVRLVRQGRWEFAQRRNTTGIAVIVARTDEQEIVLVEQFRPPIGKNVIELPAGLIGDIPGQEDEAFETAARRELLEETGFEAKTWSRLGEGPPSAGMISEWITLFGATGLTRVHEGGGDESEDITVHLVAMSTVDAWLQEKAEAGVAIDPKVYAGLYHAGRM